MQLLSTSLLRLRLLCVMAIALVVLSGCTAMFTIPIEEGTSSLLQPIQTSPDSVTLEIFHVRIPASDEACFAELWQNADEMRLDVDSRHELIRNGFRAGVLGSSLPDALASHLNLQSELPEESLERLITSNSADPKVTRRVLQLNRRETATLQATDLQNQVHVFMSEESGIRGRSYSQAEAVYTMQADAESGENINLELVPEIQHGELRSRYAGGDQGMFLLTQSRDRDTFDNLTMKTKLSAGELLVVGCLPDASGSLGHAFHAQNYKGPTDYKLILVRLLEIPGSEILASIEP